MLETLPHLQASDFPAISRGRTKTLQVNLGYRCNQRCRHCHVDAGPRRVEMMEEQTVEQLIGLFTLPDLGCIDLTGGAPEMHPFFTRIVMAARQQGLQVIDRCNLTILSEPGYEGLADFLAAQKVEISASLPCYLESNVDAQRGEGVFEASIAGLRKLNALGYGDTASGLTLNLVYNPLGPSLPPPQQQLEADYKRELFERYGVRFDRLLTITNMPIKRFGSRLLTEGQFDSYMQILKKAHRPENLESAMCSSMVSIDWQGRVYDCDFNQMLGLPIMTKDGPMQISDLASTDLCGRGVTVLDHCYGCTAGQGSSCGGALA